MPQYLVSSFILIFCSQLWAITPPELQPNKTLFEWKEHRTSKPFILNENSLSNLLSIYDNAITQPTDIILSNSVKEIWIERLRTDTSFLEKEIRSYEKNQITFWSIFAIAILTLDYYYG